MTTPRPPSTAMQRPRAALAAELEAAPPPVTARCGGLAPSEPCFSGGEASRAWGEGPVDLRAHRTTGEGARGEDGEEAPMANPWPWHGPAEDDDDELGATVCPRASLAASEAAASGVPPVRLRSSEEKQNPLPGCGPLEHRSPSPSAPLNSARRDVAGPVAGWPPSAGELTTHALRPSSDGVHASARQPAVVRASSSAASPFLAESINPNVPAGPLGHLRSAAHCTPSSPASATTLACPPWGPPTPPHGHCASPPCAAHSRASPHVPPPTYAPPPPPAPGGFSASETRPLPARAVPRPQVPQAQHPPTPTTTTMTPSLHMYTCGVHSSIDASCPCAEPPGALYPRPGYPPQPTRGPPEAPLVLYTPPLPPRPDPAPFATLSTSFGPSGRSALPYPSPPRTLYAPPTPPPVAAGTPRASSSSFFSGAAARRWLDKTSQMLETKLDEVLQQAPPRRPVYGSLPGGRPPVAGRRGYPGGAVGDGSHRYA